MFAAALREVQPPFVMLHVHGPGGVGKSTLLGEFAHLCAEAGVTALSLDGRNIQPTPDGLLGALRELTGSEDPLSALPDRHALLIDTYEALAPLDGWLRLARERCGQQANAQDARANGAWRFHVHLPPRDCSL